MSETTIFLNKGNQHVRRFIGVVLAISFSLGSVTHADYLDELALEAEATSKVPNKDKQTTAPILEKNKMEKLLEGSRPSIYLFYSRLGKNAKSQVFKSYMKDKSSSHHRLSHLQKSVLNLYLGK